MLNQQVLELVNFYFNKGEFKYLLEQTKEKYELGKKLYIQDNLSLTQISKQLKIHRGRFTEYIKAQGINVTNKQNESQIYSDIFEMIDTEEKAYWLGFLYADGYVGAETNHIEIALAKKDIEHIKKFAKFINYDGKILNDDIRTRITFRNKKMHSDLIKLGCIPNKSLLITFPTKEQIPKHLLRHFVRGFIDGDGYIGIHANGFGRFSLTCGSKQFIEDLISNMNWIKRKIHKDKRSNALSIEWAGHYVCDMLDELYENSSVYLDRKYKKYIEIKNAVLSQIS